MKLTKDVVEHIYSGLLGKVIGVQLGSPIEGMWYNRIKNTYGEITNYLFNYDFYAADDDINGPLLFLRGLEDGGHGKNMTAQDVGDALLNYAPYEHGFFWWGGYGISTEHTAYLNLRAGVKAGESGSVELNGSTVAEQIGGQIFIDTWGLVTPGEPDLAAKLAAKAASVTHGGNGIYGGVFIASCVSYAFVEKDVRKIIEKGLSYIPADCEYARVVRDVIKFHDEHPDDWRACYLYVRENWGYEKYPGNCHIIPNTAVIILSLLYGGGDYSRTVCICNMCGWDTDCNAGNVGAIMGVVCGIDGIDDKWVKPVNDLIVCSGVVGKYNITDAASSALYIAHLAAELTGEKLPEPYGALYEADPYACSFELPKSTQAINVLCAEKDEEVTFDKKRYGEGEVPPKPRYSLSNSAETAFDGERSLKVKVKYPRDGERVFVFKRTYYHPSDFSDSRYDPSFSPVAYPGQTVKAGAYIPADTYSVSAAPFYYDERNGKFGFGEKVTLKAGEWNSFELNIPKIKAGLIRCVGVCFDVANPEKKRKDFVCHIDALSIVGNANYTIDFSKEKREYWAWKHVEVSQFTRLKGLLYLADGQLNLSGPDFAEAYTGDADWKDYSCSFALTPVAGKEHFVNVRVQGAMRSYAVGFDGGEFCIKKNLNGYKKLIGTKVKWSEGLEYRIDIKVKGNTISAKLDGEHEISFTDEKSPLLRGSVGVSNFNGSHTLYREITIK